MKYCETVRDISAKGGDWRYYDEQFRFLRQSDPNIFPWDHIHWELWFQTMISARNNGQKAVATSERDKPPNRVWQQFPKGTCWAFHGAKLREYRFVNKIKTDSAENLSYECNTLYTI